MLNIIEASRLVTDKSNAGHAQRTNVSQIQRIDFHIFSQGSCGDMTSPDWVSERVTSKRAVSYQNRRRLTCREANPVTSDSLSRQPALSYRLYVKYDRVLLKDACARRGSR